MMLLLASILAVAATPEPAKPQFVRLNPGHVLVVDGAGKFAISAAPDLPKEDEAAIEQVRTAGDEALGPNSVSTVRPAGSLNIPDGQLSFHLLHVGNETALFIRNGLPDSARYKLMIKTADGIHRTDVCEVFPRTHFTEHWPYKIEWVAIGPIDRFQRIGDAAPKCE